MSPDEGSASFVARLQAHKGILYKVANAYCTRREERGDLIQSMIVELWRAFPRFDRRASFATWMYRVAMNVAISFHRSEGRRIRDAIPLEELGRELEGADARVDAEGDDMRALRQLIARLDPINRALVLLYLEGYEHGEIGEMLGMSASNVGTRINRIKSRWQQEHASP